MLVILMSICKFGWTSIVVWASLNTVQSHAFALGGLHGIPTIIFYCLIKIKPHKFETIGCLCILIGCALMISDPQAKRVGQEPNYKVSALVLTANFPGSWYFMLTNYFQKHYMTPDKTVLIISVFEVFIYVFMAIAFEGAKFDMSDNGIFGLFR